MRTGTFRGFEVTLHGLDHHPDTLEGKAAFREKGAPRFNHALRPTPR